MVTAFAFAPQVQGDASLPHRLFARKPVQVNGRLRVKGTRLVNSKGKGVVLKGVSTHGITQFPQYVTKATFKTLRDQWGVNCIRLAMYTEEYNGYCSGGDQKKLKKLIHNGVKYATELGMYVIIDWHILSDGNPEIHQKEARLFFREMASRYKKHKNVFYEICNEPNGNVSWDQVRKYATSLVLTIRKYDKKNIILVGSPTWSQDVDIASRHPLEGCSNVMYTFHFYAATHKGPYREKVQTAIDNGLPVFVSEFGICEASGNGTVDKEEGNRWLSFLRKNGISYVCWNLSNKDETSALLKASCTRTHSFQAKDLSEEGKWYKAQK